MTEHWWRELPFRGGGLLDQGTSIAERWPENYTELLGIGGDAARTKTWQGSVDSGHPPVFAFVDYRPSEDFKGKGMTMDAGPSIRWSGKARTWPIRRGPGASTAPPSAPIASTTRPRS